MRSNSNPSNAGHRSFDRHTFAVGASALVSGGVVAGAGSGLCDIFNAEGLEPITSAH